MRSAAWDPCVSVRSKLIGVALCALLGCASEQPRRSGSERAAPKAPIGVSSAPVDILGAAGRASLPFRARGDGFEATASGLRATLRSGRLVVEPRGANGPPSASLALEPQLVRRGAFVERAPAGVAAFRADGSVATSSGSFREILRSSASGLEQSWEFDGPVGTRGDLVVRIRASGQRFVSATETGLHFTDPKTGRGVRYGHGTWVDRAGHRTPVPAAYAAGDIVLRVPDRVVSESVYPASLDPDISAEFGIDVPVGGDPSYYILHPTAARAGGTYLVVWTDFRGENHSDLYGVRIDASTGVFLDPTGFLINQRPDGDPAANAPTHPVVTSSGTEFLVLWDEARDAQNGTNVYSRRIRTDGTLLDGPLREGGVLVAGTSDVEAPASAFFDGTNYLVVWTKAKSAGSSAYTLAAAQLDGKTGALLGASPTSGGIELMPAGGDVAFATNGSNVLVASDSRFVRVSLGGALLDTTPKLFSWLPGTPTQGFLTQPAVWWDGTNYVVFHLWNYDIRATRVTGAGAVLDPPDDFNLLPGGSLVCTGVPGFDFPRVFDHGSGPVLVWASGSDVFVTEAWGSRVDPATKLLLDKKAGEPCGIPLGFSYTSPVSEDDLIAVADAPGGFLVVHDGFGQRYGDDLAPLGPEGRVIANAAPQDDAAVASNGRDFLVAWLEHRSDAGDRDVYAARVAGDGTVLDPVAIPLSTVADDASSVAVASDGTDYMVVWVSTPQSSRPRVHGTRVSAAGVALDGAASTDSVVLDQTFSNDVVEDVAVASDGVGYFVAWDVGKGPWRLEGIRFDASGAALTSYGGQIAIPIASDPAVAGMHVRMAADRASDPTLRTYSLVWEQEESTANRFRHSVHGARVRAALGRFVGDSVLSPSGDLVSNPSLWTDGTDFLTAWTALRNKSPSQGSDYDVFGARFSALDGSALGPTLSIGTSNQLADTSTLAFDGRHYWALWTEYLQPSSGGRVAAMRLDTAGATLDGPPSTGAFTVSPIEVIDAIPSRVAAAANGAGKVLAVYTSFDSAPTVRQTRIRARLLQDSPAELDGGIVFHPSPPDAALDGEASVVSAGGAPNAESGAGGSIGAGGTTESGASGGGPEPTGGASNGGASNGGASNGGSTGLADARPAAGSSASDAARQSDLAAASDSGGCGCRVGSAPAIDGSGWLVFGALAAIGRRRAQTKRRKRGAAAAAGGGEPPL